MENILRDPIWQFVGVAISLIALVVAALAIRVQQQRKLLSYHFASDRPVLYLFDKGLEDRLVLTLDGNPVQGLSSHELSVYNSGNVPILPTDYYEDLVVKFPENCNVLAVAVSDSQPKNLGINVVREESFFRLSPILLNPGDEYTIQFLLDQSTNEIASRPLVTGRVAGVKELSSKGYPPRYGYGSFYRFLLRRLAPIFLLGILSGVGFESVFRYIKSLF